MDEEEIVVIPSRDRPFDHLYERVLVPAMIRLANEIDRSVEDDIARSQVKPG